jgi:hypothetical protein
MRSTAQSAASKVQVTKGRKVTIPCTGVIVAGGAIGTGILSLGAPGVGTAAAAAGGVAVVGGGIGGGIASGGIGGSGGGGGGTPVPGPSSASE